MHQYLMTASMLGSWCKEKERLVARLKHGQEVMSKEGYTNPKKASVGQELPKRTNSGRSMAYVFNHYCRGTQFFYRVSTMLLFEHVELVESAGWMLSQSRQFVNVIRHGTCTGGSGSRSALHPCVSTEPSLERSCANPCGTMDRRF